MLPLVQVSRVWLEVDGYTLPDCAQYNQIQELPSEILQLTLPAFSPELLAVSFGRKFTVTAKHYSTVLEITPSGTTGKAIDRNKMPPGYEIHQQDPATSQAKASVGRTILKLVRPGHISGDSQIAILAGGEVEVSENLIGLPIAIQCPIVYPEVALMSEEPLGEFIVHIVGKGDEGLTYLKLPHCRLPDNARIQTRSLSIKYSLQGMEKKLLNGTKSLEA